MRKRTALSVVVGILGILATLGSTATAAPPFDRTLNWTQDRTATDNTAIPATDNLVGHAFHCSALFDNTTCTEIGVGAPNATIAVIPSPQRPNSTAWYKVRTEWKEQNTLSDYSNIFQFFLKGWQAKPPRLDAVN